MSAARVTVPAFAAGLLAAAALATGACGAEPSELAAGEGATTATGAGADAGATATVPAPAAEPAPATTVVTPEATATQPEVPAATAPPAGTAGGPADPLAGVRFFAASSPWNSLADGLRVDPNSERLLAQAKVRIAAQETAGSNELRIEERVIDEGLFVNTEGFTTPIYTNLGGERVDIFCRQSRCGPDAPRVRSIVVPPDAQPDPAHDGWFTAIDLDRRVAVDLWRARREPGTDVMSYQYLKLWDLDGPGHARPVETDPENAVSARGSGLPLFAGIILPGELRAGRIDHALAIAVPGPAQRNFVQPASVTDGVGRLTSLPEGARIRLKDTARLRLGPTGEETPEQRADRLLGVDRGNRLADEKVRRSARAIERALRRYGAIVVERAAVPTLYAQRNGDYRRLLRGDEVQSFTLDDFEVLSLGRVYQDPPRDEIVEAGFGDELLRSSP